MSSVVDSRPPFSHPAPTWPTKDAGSDQMVQQHDQVIQRLFAAGLRIQGLRRHLSDREALERISVVGAELDAAIRDLRRTIHSLRSRPPTFSAGILALVAAMARDHALQPELHLSGPLDIAVDPGVVEHVQGVLKEGLGRAFRDAAAHSITITLRAGPDHLELGITDDGAGSAEPASGRGPTAMRCHADLCAGTLSISNSLGAGTRVLLIVPLRSRRAAGNRDDAGCAVGVPPGPPVVRG